MPQFFSETLQDAFMKSQDNLVAFQERLNQISHDIKNIEKYLQEMNICLPTLMECFHQKNGENILMIYYLEWAEYAPIDNPQKSQFRLIYHEIERCLTSCQDKIFKRPLAEAKIQVKLDLFRYLPGFVLDLNKNIEVDRLFHYHSSL